MNILRTSIFVLVTIFFIPGCKKAEMETKKQSDLESKMKRFAPVEITADISKLTEGDQRALAKLFEASRILDKIYIRQIWSGNEALRQKLEADHTSEGLRRLKYFNINMSHCPLSTMTRHSSRAFRSGLRARTIIRKT